MGTLCRSASPRLRSDGQSRRAADVEQRSPEEVVDDAVDRYLRLIRRERLYAYGEGQAERVGIEEEDVSALVKEIRRDASAHSR
jgi:hypothetical protein